MNIQILKESIFNETHKTHNGGNKMTQVRVKPHLRKKPHSRKKIRVAGYTKAGKRKAKAK